MKNEKLLRFLLRHTFAASGKAEEFVLWYDANQNSMQYLLPWESRMPSVRRIRRITVFGSFS